MKEDKGYWKCTDLKTGKEMFRLRLEVINGEKEEEKFLSHFAKEFEILRTRKYQRSNGGYYKYIYFTYYDKKK